MPPAKTDPLAVAALILAVLGIIAFVGLFLSGSAFTLILALVASLIAHVFGVIALIRTWKRPEKFQGLKLAIIGFGLAVLSLVSFTIYLQVELG